MIQISDCPDSDLNRFITSIDWLHYQSANQINFICHVSHFRNDEKVENKGIRNYKITFVLSNENPVNKNTGDLTTWEDEDSIGQYDYHKSLQIVSAVQTDTELKLIQDGDLLGKFDV